MATWSTTQLSTIRSDFGRIDAEFYKSEFLETDRILGALPTTKLRKIATKIDVGHVGPMVRHYTESGVALLQTQNVQPFFLKMENVTRVDEAFHQALQKSQVRYGNILVARSGSFGSAAVYLENQVINSADIIIIDIDEDGIEPLYVLAFLNSVHGSSQLIRFASGGIQGHVNLKILEHLKVPIPSEAEQEAVRDLVLEAYEARKRSDAAYLEAAELVDAQVPLHFPAEKATSYVGGFAEVVSQNRFDADYFQPAYAVVKKAISSYGNGFAPLIALCVALRPNIDPQGMPGATFDYIELSGINGAVGTVDETSQSTGRRLPSRARRQVSSGDVLASSVIGSLDKAALISEAEDGFVASTGFFHLRPRGVPSEVLLMLMRSTFVRMQLQQEATGGILSAVPESRLSHVLVPLLPIPVQQRIVELVKKSHLEKETSERLMQEAKASVERFVASGISTEAA